MLNVIRILSMSNKIEILKINKSRDARTDFHLNKTK